MAVLTYRDLETVDATEIVVNVSAGRVDVEAGDHDRTRVELSALSDNPATAAAIEKATLEVRGRGDSQLVVDVPSRRLGSGPQVLVRVTCPEGLGLTAKTASAEVDAHGRLGAVRIATASGAIRLESVGSASINTASGDVVLGSASGDVTVNTASGSVDAGKLGGETKIRSASGDVSVAEVDGSLSAHSASGDQRLDAVRAGSVKLHTASGDVTVGIRQGSTLWLDARSMSGDMSSEIPLGDGPSEGVAGGPHVELRAVSMSGDVRVVRAP